MIAESVVLLRVEYLEQYRRRITTIISAEFVDLIQHHHRIIYLGAPDRLNDAPRHSADVRTAVSPQLGLVAYATQAKSFKVTAECPSDRFSKRCLAHARGS